MKKPVEAMEILKRLDEKKLRVLDEVKKDTALYNVLMDFFREEIERYKDIIYRLPECRNLRVNETLHIDKAYYRGRTSSLVLLAHLMENAGRELDRRSK